MQEYADSIFCPPKPQLNLALPAERVTVCVVDVQFTKKSSYVAACEPYTTPAQYAVLRWSPLPGKGKGHRVLVPSDHDSDALDDALLAVLKDAGQHRRRLVKLRTAVDRVLGGEALVFLDAVPAPKKTTTPAKPPKPQPVPKPPKPPTKFVKAPKPPPAYRKANPERERTRNKAWRKANADKIAAYAAENAERRRTTQQVRYDRQAEVQRERSRQYKRANRERYREQNRQWREANPDKTLARMKANSQRKFDAGFMPTKISNLLWIHRDDYAALVTEQGGGCAICQQVCVASNCKRMVLDHDHVTGLPRGVLCHWCNIGISAFEGRPELLDAANVYILDTYRHRHQFELTERLGYFPKTAKGNLGVTKQAAEDAWVAERNGSCEICGKIHSRMARDHCHASNRYRGLLCEPHNLALGCFPQPCHLTRAKAYLLRTSNPEHQQRLFERLSVRYAAWKIAERERKRLSRRAANNNALRAGGEGGGHVVPRDRERVGNEERDVPCDLS